MTTLGFLFDCIKRLNEMGFPDLSYIILGQANHFLMKRMSFKRIIMSDQFLQGRTMQYQTRDKASIEDSFSEKPIHLGSGRHCFLLNICPVFVPSHQEFYVVYYLFYTL